MLKEITIPKERVAVLIGSNGVTKREICKKTNVNIKIDDNIIEISGDPVSVMNAEQIIYAIGRGFSPMNAMKLLNEDYYIDTIDLPKEKNALVRMRARLIGQRGKIKKYIENSTGTTISIYGKTACIIGKDDRIASEAIKMILDGKEISAVYKFLDKMKNEREIL